MDRVPSDMPTNTDFALKSVALIGTLVGQLTFGRLGDLFGRKSMHGATMVTRISPDSFCSGLADD
jgi:PHS family inorganic phosphate transporter-like MFS transporter